MACTACGCEQVAGALFCRQCGAPVAAAVPPGVAGGPPPGWGPGWVPGGMPLAGPAQYSAALEAEKRMRVRQNLQPLGIIWIMFGIYRVIMGMVGALVLHNLVHGGIFSEAPPFLPHLMGSLVPVIATVSAVMGIGDIVTGYGLLARQQWGRMVAIIFGVLALLKIPFGTALGIYTLWVLAPGTSGAEWEIITREPPR